jgi:hypothetical protein
MGFVKNILSKLSSIGNFKHDVIGNFNDIESNITMLISSPTNDGVLVLQVVGHEAFVQLSGGRNGVEIDFAVITPFQKSKETAIRSFFKGRGLEIRESTNNGSLFLDVSLASNAVQITTLVKQLLNSVFAIDPTAKLQFMGERLGVAA